MDAKDHVNQQLYEILEELFDKARNMSPSRHSKPEMSLDQNHDSGKRISSIDKDTPTKNQKANLSNLSFKELSTAKEKLNDLKNELNQNPRKYKTELAKINGAENKITNAMEKRKNKDLNKAIDVLKKNPRRYVLKVVETKNKLDTLRIHLEKNPRRHKSALDKVNKLESKLNQKIDKMKTQQIRKAIYVIQRNPQKYGQELKKFQDIEKKLNNKSDLEKKHEKDTGKDHEKSKEKSMELTM
ncbi:hypothetical protein [Halobacillus amylolyticus]|uniref:Uncharacterized protein n=1 Tax=Halobacillus amylolyticus TaxID=2932259 RepID=A0ABY4HGP1_9BACI|nr:hypothetical protein [Halobacillus amylolyticus]UOR14095.1 hypothetical protein MUO15_21300 [Halobacillus amylolyticus]